MSSVTRMEDKMVKPLGTDLRWRVVNAVEEGMSTRQVAKRFSVSVASAGAWVRLKRATGDVKPRKQGKPSCSRLDAHEAFIDSLIEERKDITLQEIAVRLDLDCGVKVVPATIWYFLDKRGITFKKNRTRGRTGARRRKTGSRTLGRRTS